MNDDSLKIGDVVEVTAERLSYGGDAVARHNGLAVFIPLAAPGDRLRVRVVERKKNFARAAVEEVLVASPARREPACRHFGDCGGCQLQHVTYQAQLEAKAGFVRDALGRVGRIDWPHEIRVLHAAEFGYRARAQIKLGAGAAGERDRAAVGFNRGASHSVCDVCDCPILAPELNSALASLRSSLSEAGAREGPPSGLGEVSEIEMAVGEAGVSADPPFSEFKSGVVQRTVRGAIYNFSPSTFFQVNPLLLDELVEQAVGGRAGGLAIDLYAGVGLFTVQLARAFDRVIGIESDAGAAGYAIKNIRANSASNARFYSGRVEQWLDAFARRRSGDDSIDFMVLDPPRSGAAGAIVKIAGLKPAHISYVSCDPTTLARDLRGLVDSGYDLKRVTALDLFPQTYHIETVARLSLC
ncbi:MAG: class I SAM-dependent RNA methyltransferase [Blastocatellia bacterium]